MFDDRTRPKVSLRGRSRQEGRQETLQRAQREREERQRQHQRQHSAVVIQSHVRAALSNRRMRDVAREQFDAAAAGVEESESPLGAFAPLAPHLVRLLVCLDRAGHASTADAAVLTTMPTAMPLLVPTAKGGAAETTDAERERWLVQMMLRSHESADPSTNAAVQSISLGADGPQRWQEQSKQLAARCLRTAHLVEAHDARALLLMLTDVRAWHWRNLIPHTLAQQLPALCDRTLAQLGDRGLHSAGKSLT